jgi:hypothetical protein
VATAGLSPADIASPIRSILRNQKNTRVILANVSGIDLAAREVLAEDRRIPYNILIIATGARYAYFGRDDWAPHAPGLKRIDDATYVRQRILVAFEKAEAEADAIKRRALLNFVVGAAVRPVSRWLAPSPSLPARRSRPISGRSTRVTLASFLSNQICRIRRRPRSRLAMPTGESELLEVIRAKAGFFSHPCTRYPSFRQLICENLQPVNFRRFGKQIAGLRLFHQSRCHRAFEMRIAPGF